MSTATLNDCTQLDTTLLERVNYFPRQLLTADDMTADQQYFIAKLRRHNRYLHGWGVVCGLTVTIAPTAVSPWMVQISPGYALGPYGDEIYVPNAVNLDLAQCGPGAATDPCSPGTLMMTGTAKTGSLIYVAIRYEECFARPVQVLPGGCGCNSNSCEPSRISDSYEIDCLGTLPPSAQPDPQGPSLCDFLSGRSLVQCPPCPTDPWIVLAQVQLPAALGSTLPQGNVDNVTFRRKIFSTAVIQEQVRLCCCAGSDRAPARVTSITPANQTVFTNGSQIPSSILITFNKHLVTTSVNTNSILVVLNNAAGVPSIPVAGSVSYDDVNMLATFTPSQPFTIPGLYQVTVVGTGPNQIVDSDNLALDGNADGSPGGNFLSNFTVQIATTPTPTPTPTVAPTPTPTPTPQPTQAPVPLGITLQGPNPVPTLTPSATAVGDLQISVTGGLPGQKIKADITVVLSQNLAQTPATDTAVCKSSTGTVNASKGANSYTFSGVIIAATGNTTAFVASIANMKANVIELVRQGGGDVIASVSIVSSTVLPPVVPPQATVAHVNRG